MAQSSGYNIAPGLEDAALKLGVGIPGRGKYFRRPYTLYHRVNVPAAGQTQFIFFNEPRAIGVTNLEQAGTLPANQLFIAHGLRFKFLCGIDRLGNRIGVAAPTQAQLVASSLSGGVVGTAAADGLAAQWQWTEKFRELLAQGQVIFRIGERDVFNQYGLEKFPNGSGVTAQTALAESGTFTAQASHQINVTQLNNGERVVSNRYSFTTKVGILAGQQFGLQVDYSRAVDFTQQYVGPLYGITGAVTAGTLMAELEGEIVTPAQ
jgi:hypothetical protein